MNQTVLDTLLQTTFTNVAGWMKDIYINSEIKKYKVMFHIKIFWYRTD